MELTQQQKEVLTELINVGIGKAAAILSSMINQEIHIFVPTVEVIPYSSLSNNLCGKFGNDGLGVSIGFEGEFSGNTSLLFGSHEGKNLVDQLLSDMDEDEWNDDDDWGDDFDDSDDDSEFTDTDKEAIIEVGNMMINGLMGSLGNLLETVLTYQPPTLDLSMNFGEIYGDSTISRDKEQFALIMETDFKAKESSISGYLMLIFELKTTINDLLKAVDRLIEADEDDF